jgi:acetylornithine deacetylase/succinyl-diaminopimelate desuccinylase-like protein
VADPGSERALRLLVERLAAIPRLPTSDGERAAARLVAARLRELGCEATVEQVPATASYAWPVGLLSAGAAAAVAGRRRRALGAIGGVLAAAAIADDISGGARWFRRAAVPRRTAWNVVGRIGDPRAARTLVLLAHHDAAPSGAVFDQRPARWVAGRFPAVVAAARSSLPMWWPVVAAPLLAAAGSALGSRRLRLAGLAGALAACAAMADIGRRPAVPGANDNASGVAALVAAAAALGRRPPPGLRVLLLSAGAEEALQEGIRGFAARHFPRLPVDATWFLNLDTVGSGRLVLLEGEGPLRLRDYRPGLKELVAGCADAEGVPLLRGLRSHNSTDGQTPDRGGYPSPPWSRSTGRS